MRATLLQHHRSALAWQDWMEANGLDTSASRFGPGFNLYSLIIRAAVSGFGVGIVPTCLVEDELAAGTLVEPLKTALTARWATTCARPRPAPICRCTGWWPGGWSIAATMRKGLLRRGCRGWGGLHFCAPQQGANGANAVTNAAAKTGLTWPGIGRRGADTTE